jgi:hypothetical protein
MVPIVLLQNRRVHARSLTILKEVENDMCRNPESKGREERTLLSKSILLGRSCRENKLSEVQLIACYVLSSLRLFGRLTRDQLHFCYLARCYYNPGQGPDFIIREYMHTSRLHLKCFMRGLS